MKLLLLFVTVAKLADVSTTATVLNQGGRELNPMLSQRPAIMATQQAAEVSAELFILHKLSAHHPKLAKGLAWVSIGGSTYGAAGNLTQIHHYGHE